MLEINTEELEVLGRFVHPEYFEQILQELSLTKPVVTDIVKQLFHHGYLKAIDKEGKTMFSIEVDKIIKTKFQLTTKGFDALNEQ